MMRHGLKTDALHPKLRVLLLGNFLSGARFSQDVERIDE